LSLYFKTSRSAYYELLDRVRTKGDWETWLDFFLIGVRDTADQAAGSARRIMARFEQDQKKIEGLGRPAASVPRVFQHMQRNPIVAIPTTAKKIGISAPTVTKSLMHMIDLGILHEVTGRERHRLFVYESSIWPLGGQNRSTGHGYDSQPDLRGRLQGLLLRVPSRSSPVSGA
jgi:Fic family protein